MPRRRNPGQASLLEARVSTAPCVPAIRIAVEEWRKNGYQGVTPTTKTLLDFWFRNDHRLRNGKTFQYHDSQRDAIETLIFVFEIAKKRSFKDLVESYAPQDTDLKLLQFDDFARYCMKMATGSGKTKVMALAIAWQYFNAVCENLPEYAKTFLVIAPNVIVFERLRTDFGGGRIFLNDPVIPKELSIFWEMSCVMKGDAELAHSDGILYLNNVQQFHEREAAKNEMPSPIADMMPSAPPADLSAPSPFAERIHRRGEPLMVINDEAHHTHDEKLKWNEIIRSLNEGPGVSSQLDFSATPRHNKGTLFSWTIFDYPLKQAILDGIVKRPMKGVVTGIEEQKSDIASTRYKSYLTAGVNRWLEYREKLSPSGMKPVLFVMMNGTTDADDVADDLVRRFPEHFSDGRLLTIHTDTSGEITKKDLDVARKLAREIDKPDNPVNCIVSVLMLREGWDVSNVTVVVGLRPFSSKSNILPEQTIGRGLRLMMRGSNSGYQERVDIIGNKTFMEFVSALEKEEDFLLEPFDPTTDKLEIFTIHPDPAKSERDIVIPQLSPILERKKTLADEIAAMELKVPSRPLPIRASTDELRKFMLEVYDVVTNEKLEEREYELKDPQTSSEVVSYYAKRIAQDVKLPSQFAALAPRVKEFLENHAFGEKVNLESPEILKAIGTNVAQHVVIQTFVSSLRGLVIQEQSPKLVSSGRALSETPPYPFSRTPFKSEKTIFNYVAPDNKFELAFAKFLDETEDVVAFAKLPRAFGFAIDYTDAAMDLRYYEPDFVAVLDNGEHVIVETKGQEDIDVKHKDRAAEIWAENATLLTGVAWRYIKVPQKGFENLQPNLFGDLWHV